MLWSVVCLLDLCATKSRKSEPSISLRGRTVREGPQCSVPGKLGCEDFAPIDFFCCTADGFILCCYFILVRALNMRSTLLKILSVQYSINHRCSVVQGSLELTSPA